jgi:hypothetical protein
MKEHFNGKCNNAGNENNENNADNADKKLESFTL